MANIKVISQTQKIIVNSTTSSITVISKLEQPIVITQALSSVSVINTGPMGPRGLTGPADATNVLTVDGQIMTRAFGGLAPITRTDLAADPAFTAYLTAHVAHANPHPDYMTTAEDAAIMSAHVAHANPHPDYMTTAEDAAIMSAHVAHSDPHPIYLTLAEGNATYLTPAGGDALFLTPAEGNAAYVNTTGDTMTGSLTITAHGGRIYTEAGAHIDWGAAHGAFEIFQPNVNSDAFLTFHVGGDFAAQFGLAGGGLDDWYVGGWSMGAVKRRIYHSGNESVWANSGVTGNSMVKRNSAGDVFARYYNMTSEIRGGWPPYIVGCDGDGYLRNYNKTGDLTFTGHINIPFGYAVTLGDTNHKIYYSGGVNGPEVIGYGGVRIATVANSRSWGFSTDGNAYNNQAAWVPGSSLKIKKDIVPLTVEEMENIAKQFTPVWFEHLENKLGRRVGGIAEWTEKFLPEVISISPDGILGMDYGPLGGIALCLTGKLIDKVEKLTQRLNQLEKK